MADKHNGEYESRYYYCLDEESAGPDEMPADCPACRGTGKVLLLVSTRPCEACGGTGKIAEAAGDGPEHTPLTDSTSSPQASSPQAGTAQAGPGAGASQADEAYDAVAGRTVEQCVPGCWVTTNTYDAENRLRSHAARFVPDAETTEREAKT